LHLHVNYNGSGRFFQRKKQDLEDGQDKRDELVIALKGRDITTRVKMGRSFDIKIFEDRQ
jgi:hypothetical protein